MPTKREREYYSMGFMDGQRLARQSPELMAGQAFRETEETKYAWGGERLRTPLMKKKRKLSAWNKFVKANSKKPRFRMRSGKLNLKKMGVAFRKKKR